MKIVVLGGGISPERDVSIRSAAAVSVALREAGFTVIEADPRDGEKIFESLESNTIIFPILHGAGGEDGEIQKVMEKHKLPYLGTDSQQSAVCFSKSQTREVLQKSGLPVAKGDLVTIETYKNHELAQIPHVLKTNKGGSSIGTLIVRKPKSVTDKDIDQVFAHGRQAVLEELVVGIEITVPILDNKALPVIEIKPPDGEEYDYINKYEGPTQLLCPPKSISQDSQVSASRLAEKANTALGCRHFSRVDIIINPTAGPVILEINTIPGMTDHSLYPKSAQVAGISFPELMKRFVDLVKRDYGIKE